MSRVGVLADRVAAARNRSDNGYVTCSRVTRACLLAGKGRVAACKQWSAPLVSGGRLWELVAFTGSGSFARRGQRAWRGKPYGCFTLVCCDAANRPLCFGADRGVGTPSAIFSLCNFVVAVFLTSTASLYRFPYLSVLDVGTFSNRLLSMASGDVENYHSRPQVGVPLVER